ncbi:MAG: hypothetical protein EBZ59_09960, partial [Planctomycetia bacterium]|nr:hypothetical protein [Planctomycetia bacterium]
MRRSSGIVFGLVTHLLFAWTVWHLFWFLKGHGPANRPGGVAAILQDALVDAALALLFAVPHSALLVPAVRRRIVSGGLGPAFYGCFYCVATCLVLLATIGAWRPSGIVAWAWPDRLRPVVDAAFVASRGALLWSLHLTGLGWQTGWTPWWRWVRGLPPARRDFAPRAAYRFLRHPVSLSFLGLIWFVPVVTLDRAVLIAVWSAYISVGSVLKDRRLL